MEYDLDNKLLNRYITLRPGEPREDPALDYEATKRGMELRLQRFRRTVAPTDPKWAQAESQGLFELDKVVAMGRAHCLAVGGYVTAGGIIQVYGDWILDIQFPDAELNAPRPIVHHEGYESPHDGESEDELEQSNREGEGKARSDRRDDVEANEHGKITKTKAR
ncbi:hypothetical protein MIND_00002000 [Mycena indigotica]|uniref:Uncharacterized protein n=1 Tax=Mycena indigotica TaxID=2126181 RepID=A0A8H6WHB1_9AGAR|nr:uncharacterized protein MIND_00002000 [Mycena indigotica]KAF7314883.1 hypothetical protein MIND_00002000 [Mycena indigotica]